MSQPNCFRLSDSSTRHIQRATELMEEIYANPGKSSLSRSNMRLIELRVDCSGLSLGEFLNDFYRKKLTVTAPLTPQPVRNQLQEEILPAVGFYRKCRGCDKVFTKAKSWNGHGEARCIINNRKEGEP